MAGLLLPLRWFLILCQKSLALLLNFNLANLNLLAFGRHIWSKNWSISSSQLMRVHGSGRPSNIGASKTTMIHRNRFSTIWNEHLVDMISTAGATSVGPWLGWFSDLVLPWTWVTWLKQKRWTMDSSHICWNVLFLTLFIYLFKFFK